MNKINSKFNVFFENPFWIGVFECESDGCYEVYKVTFGAEPKDSEIYEFLLKKWNRIKTTKQSAKTSTADKHLNPKRMQKEIKKQLEQKGIGTKAQQALKESYELFKMEKKQITRKQREEENQKRFELKQQKKKEKHRGH